MKIGIVGAPVDLGQQRRGVDMGPSAIRIARLEERLESLGHRVKDFGNIPAVDMATATAGEPSARYLRDVVKQCEQLSTRVAECARTSYFPLILGGDQSTSIGTLAGLSSFGTKRGIIWLDAHGDFNTPKTTPSGNIHGMALAAILGHGEPRLVNLGGKSPKALERNTVLIGGRSFDPGEARAISHSKMTVYTMREIDELGMRKVMKEALKVASDGVRDVHLSFDVDAIDPREAPGTGTPVNGGLTYREAQLAMELAHDSDVVTSAEFVEVNPILDVANHTAELAVELALSLFGKKILAD
jgi:arginase